MANGKVKWFNDAKGYGFITRDEDGKDVFVHYSSIAGDGFRSLAQGEAVRYTLTEGPKGLFAADVMRLEGSPISGSGSGSPAPSGSPTSQHAHSHSASN